MADPTQDQSQVSPPWERFTEPEATDQESKPAPPWERYGDYEVVPVEDKYEGDLADAGAEALTQRAVDLAHQATIDEGGGSAVENFWRSAVKGTLVGPVADPIAALVLSHPGATKLITGKDIPDISYKQALRVVRSLDEGRESTAGTIAGALVGGGYVAAGLKKSAQWAATRSGLARAGMQWASKDKILNRVVAASAAGGAAGAVEEGIRTTLEESFDASAGQEFEGDRIKDNVILGSLLGAAATPALQEGLNGGKWFYNYLKKVLGADDATTYAAASSILRSFARDNETLDDAADRFRQTVQEYRFRNKRMPAAAQVMKPEQVADVSDVIRSYSGLDIRARELGEEGVERVLKDYDHTITGGEVIETPEFMDHQLQKAFTDVVRRRGDTMVSVDDETMQLLAQNRKWIRALGADGNEGAKSMSRILDAEADIRGLEKNYQRILDSKNNADAFDEVKGFEKRLAELLDKAFRSGQGGASEIAEMRNLVQMSRAIANKAKSERNATAAGFNLDEFRPILSNAMREIADYEKFGLRISLSDANDIRVSASRMYNSLRGSQYPVKEAKARRIRDIVTPIGKAEVPEYGEVVKRWNIEKNRIEAYETGEAAARGEVPLLDLETRLLHGRLPRKPAATGEEQKEAIRKGAGEGLRGFLSRSARGTTSEGVRTAEKISGSRNVKESLEVVLGSGNAKKITQAADNVVDTYNSMKALAQPKSVSDLAEDRRVASDILTGAAIGNLGGAGRAALYTRAFMRLQIPRGTAKKIVEMLGNPDEMDKALAFMQRKNIQVGPFFSAFLSHLTEPNPNPEPEN